MPVVIEKLSNWDEYYYLTIKLNVGNITCDLASIFNIEPCVGSEPLRFPSYLGLNNIMTLTKYNDSYHLEVNGPDGGVYYDQKTDLTDEDFQSLMLQLYNHRLNFIKNATEEDLKKVEILKIIGCQTVMNL